MSSMTLGAIMLKQFKFSEMPYPSPKPYFYPKKTPKPYS